jgi:hypothetical protein
MEKSIENERNVRSAFDAVKPKFCPATAVLLKGR